jgi:hypothetical protein
MKTIYYYQTFIGLDKLLGHAQDIDMIFISSIHFNKNKYGNRLIYLNDNEPYERIFNNLWCQTQLISSQGVTIGLMIGGAGLAFQELFSDFTHYYPQLKELLRDKTWIKAINLDVEEKVDINQIKMLLRILKDDFPDIHLSMAPVANSLVTDSIGLGGFSYKELYNSYEERLIDAFFIQAYQDFSFDIFDRIVKNGYPPEKLVLGMLSSQYTSETFPDALDELKKIKEAYPKMIGAFDWEYIDAPPNTKDPSEWSRYIKSL